MIELDFQPDERALAEDAETAPHAADPAALRETYFEMPLRFTVDGAEVLGIGQGPWWPLPLLGFATKLDECVRALKEEGRAELWLAGGGVLYWQARADSIEVRNSPGGWTVKLSLAELEPAVAALLERVRAFLLSRFPLMVTHPDWARWFGDAR